MSATNEEGRETAAITFHSPEGFAEMSTTSTTLAVPNVPDSGGGDDVFHDEESINEEPYKSKSTMRKMQATDEGDAAANSYHSPKGVSEMATRTTSTLDSAPKVPGGGGDKGAFFLRENYLHDEESIDEEEEEEPEILVEASEERPSPLKPPLPETSPPSSPTPTVTGVVIDDDDDEGGCVGDGGGGESDGQDGRDNGAQRPSSSAAPAEEAGGGGDEEEQQLRLDPGEVSELKALLPSLRRLREEEGDAAFADKGAGARRQTSFRNNVNKQRAVSMAWIGGGGGGRFGDSDDSDGSGKGGLKDSNVIISGYNNVDGDDDSSASSSSPDDEYIRLPRDTFSLLFAAGPRTFPFAFALFTYAFQMLILVLVLVDIVDPSDPDNPLNVPAGVSPVVSTAQFTAVVVAVATQDDLIASLNTVHMGYPGIGWVANESGGSQWQWIFAEFCRFSEGALCLSTTFILIVQSDAVVDLFLDFMAMLFVSEIDNISFGLAREGYFSGAIKREARLVSEARIPNLRKGNKWCCLPFRQVLFCVVFLSMVAGWSVIVHKQNAGEFQSCDSIVVQFGDTFAPQLAFFSGMYELHAELKFDRRVSYWERKEGRHHGRGVIAYCEEEKAWTFSYSESSPEPCEWYAKAESDEYDVMEISPSDWYVLGQESSEEVPFLHLSYECEDCRDKSERGLCGDEHGKCIDNRCVCEPGRHGRRCEFAEPCGSIEVDTSEEGFPGLAQRYTVLRGEDGNETFAYGRPVFVANATTTAVATADNGGVGKNRGVGLAIDFIVFTGRRWMLTSTAQFDNGTAEIHSLSDLAAYMTDDFHAYWTPFTSLYSSAPMDMNTPQDSLTPAGLAWYRTKSGKRADDNRRVPALLLCAECHNETNPCRNGGACTEARTCECPYGAFGVLCQIAGFDLCRSLFVQYGDEVRASLGAFAGPYDLARNGTKIDGRSVYYERNQGRSMFAYCEVEQAWTFSPALYPVRGIGGGNSSVTINAESKGVTGTALGGQCTDWVAMSPVTDSYDITSANTDWVVRRTTDVDEGVPLVYFSLRCNDCDPADRRSCGVFGRCVDNRCVCAEGRYGNHCELFEPCPAIELDSSKRGFPGMTSSHYTLLAFDDGTRVKSYDRPVFVDEKNGGGSGSFDMISFVGRRWIVSKSSTHSLLANATTRQELAEYFTTSFHAYFSNYTVEYMSEPADVSTLVDTPSPVDLVWFGPKSFNNQQVDISRQIKASLLCSYCNDVDYVCYNGGHCAVHGNDTWGKCLCPRGTYGTLCQIQPRCERVLAQFGPELGEAFSSRSGTYQLSGDAYGGRPTYVLKRSSGGGANQTAGEAAMFAYCPQEKAWTFTTAVPRATSPGVVAPQCESWIAKSTPTITYDITTLSSLVTRGGTNGDELVPLSFFSLSCVEDEIIVH